MDVRPIRVVPRVPMDLEAEGNPGEAKVCRAVAHAWKAIPPALRQSVRVWLRTGPGPRSLTIRSLKARCFDGRGIFAVFDGAFRTIDFKSHVAARMPLDCLYCLAAHELAHVVQTASGRPRAPFEEREAEADELATSWGFPGDVIHRWHDQQNRNRGDRAFRRLKEQRAWVLWRNARLSGRGPGSPEVDR